MCVVHRLLDSINCEGSARWGNADADAAADDDADADAAIIILI